MTKVDFKEYGSNGLQADFGFVRAAYTAELNWPSVYPLYNRMRRSDPEISMVRQVFSTLSRFVKFDVAMGDEPNDAEKRAAEFLQQAMDDIDGGPHGLLETIVSNVPFFGWGWWEAVPGVRNPGWVPPDDDPWRSQYKDNLIGFRRLAWRDPSTFQSWDLDEYAGRLRGMRQSDFPRPSIILPLERSLHMTFGDSQNPEGLTPLEACYRLERIKYGLEIVQGIGFEHAAGYLDVKVDQEITPENKIMIDAAARNILAAQEGNYGVWPAGVTAEVKDVTFQAALSLLETIKYYGILKLTLFNMQWMSMSTVSGSGSYSALQDSSSMFMVSFNAMLNGFADQIDQQIGKRLLDMNPGAFAGMENRPHITIKPLQKVISLSELGSIISVLKNTMPLGDEDYKAIRQRTGFLPEALPEVENKPEPKPEPAEDPEENPDEDNPDDEPADSEKVAEAMTGFREYCKTRRPDLYRQLNRRVK